MTKPVKTKAPPACVNRVVNDTDRHIGLRVRGCRTRLGLTQQQFADVINVSCQQVCKYERGMDRISARRLFEIAIALETPIIWFFEGMTLTDLLAGRPRQKKAIELARDFEALDNEKHRDALCRLAKVLAAKAVAARDGGSTQMMMAERTDSRAGRSQQGSDGS